MKILITEEQLKQWKETFTHCYAETERRITDRAKALSEMQTALDAAEKVEPVNADLATEIEAIDAWYRGDPKYEHDAYWMRDAAKRLVLKFPPLYTDMHFQRLASNRYADIVQLREELEAYKLSDKLGSEREKEMREELDLLRTQVRELRLQRDSVEKERDEVRFLNKALIKNRINAAEDHAGLVAAVLAVCCDPAGTVVIRGSDGDRAVLQAALAKIGEKQ